MKQNFLNSSMNLICKYQSFSDDDQKKLRYGLEGLYLTLTKTIVLFILAFLLNMVVEFLLILLFFNFIRFTGFGFHAKKSTQCLIISIFNFIVIPYFLFHIKITTEILYIVSALCIIHYILLSPADTIKRPLTNFKKRMIRKTLTVLIGIIYTLIIAFSNNMWLNTILLASMIIEAINIHPLLYKIFKQPYKNYKILNTKSV